MSNFVTDGTPAIPGPKTDARPIDVPTSQAVAAADWNPVRTALYDIRTYLLALPAAPITAGNNNQPGVGPFTTISNDGDHLADVYSPATNEWGHIIGSMVAINSDNTVATHIAAAVYRRVAGTLTIIQQGNIFGPIGNHTYRFDFVESSGKIAVQYTGVGLQTITWQWGPFTVTKF
jgi:hypothetical protein